MDSRGLQQRINRGMGRAARVLGDELQVYRPVDPLAPIDLALTSLRAKLDQDFGFRHRKPGARATPLYYLLADAGVLRVGDYLTGAPGTWFVGAMETNMPPACIRCNRTVTVSRPRGSTKLGINPPGGRRDGTDDPLMRGWPASVLRGGLDAAGAAALPASARLQGVEILLPAVEGLTLRTGDRATDDLGVAYTIGSAELTAHGWRLAAATSEV